MMKTTRFIVLAGIFLSVSHLSIAQRDKEGTYVAPAGNTVVNTYTYLTANATAGTNSIIVNSNAMTGGVFGGNLAPGDLIMIIQMQGTSIDVNTTPTVSWGGNYTVPTSYFNPIFPAFFGVNPENWGGVTNYNQSGLHERVEVLSVSGANTITLNCNLINSYTSTGHVQVIRIPRFTDLTVNAGATIEPTLWNGNSGGVVALEVNGTLTVNAGGSISASAFGFRGGQLDPNSLTATGDVTQVRHLGSFDNLEGSEKGEGVAGYYTEYDLMFSRYGIGAPATGGGGGGYQNTGGGGGCNVMVGGTYTGQGNPQGYTATWNLEAAGFGGSTSSGGGRGGYAYSNIDMDATVVGPRNNLWGGDGRKTNGGFGGHPLPFVADRVWFGGGGGAGDQDSDEGGAGGRGGGLVFMNLYGPIAGSGTIEANGEAGQNSNPSGATASPGSPQVGNDGAGGGGAGGSIHIVNVSPFPGTMLLDAHGGDGGDQDVGFYNPGPPFPTQAEEASGPGGSGSGGYIRITSGAPVKNVVAGVGGTTNSSHLTEFPPNGATEGSDGFPFLPANPAFNIILSDITICEGSTVNLSATVFGTPLGTVTWFDAMVGGSVVTTGNSYLTPVLNATTTYWVGTCPGSFREPVTVIVTPTDDPSYTYSAPSFCVSDPNPSPTVTGLAGGTFTSSPAGLTINNGTGLINVSTSTPASYTITYTTSGPCPTTATFGITIDPCPLPIELYDFWGNCENYPVLHWQTSSEYDNDYFTLERSCNMIDYEFVAMINGLANSSTLTDYIYMDNDRANCNDPKLFYRLSQTDFNGVKEIVGHVATNCRQNTNEPSLAMMDKTFRIQYENDFAVNVYSTTGKLVFQGNSSSGKILIDKSEYSAGVYIIRIASDQVFTKRVMVSN